MMAISCFRKLFVRLFILSLFLLPISCVISKDVWIAEDQILADVYSKKDMPAAVEIKPISKQIINLPEKGPLKITVEDAILIALENNRSLLVERINPFIQKTFEDQELAVFDPIVNAGVSIQQDDSKTLNQSGRYADSSANDAFAGSISLKKFFPTGTFVEVAAGTKTTDSDQYSEQYSSTRLGLSVTQSLLQGYGTDVNLARLRQSQLETDITQYELRGFSESLLAQVETTYWDYALSLRQMEIVEESLKLARQQITETEEMIKVGATAEAELAAVQAEVAAQQQGLIDAKSTLESNRLRLIRLLNPSGDNPWERDITLLHPPTLPEIKYDEVGAHVAVALRMRPEMNQARIDIQKNDIEIVRTKNGLLPKMDLFITLGKTGYADSFSGSVNVIKEDSYDMMVGLNFEYPVLNRNARAKQRRALLSRDKAEMALDNLKQIIELDVRNAYIELNRTKEQIFEALQQESFRKKNCGLKRKNSGWAAPLICLWLRSSVIFSQAVSMKCRL
ncbi:MAG: TolC family protein [Proteobacteria bacterium]|nr:TolC family protein [Pseudomonadota bacterium]